MKAVIMTGGKGTRLRPLTCHLPKPMVPLLDKPCMEYIIELLKRHGITEIAVTVQYLPQSIQSYFGDGSEWGVRLHYFEETVPLGTAGSVKNAQSFLDETFLVISGDALTDFDLQKAMAFHQKKKGLGTLVITKVEVPLEYGVVMTGEDGRIIRFLEKPSWSEVFSDTVNTGIYVLEPEILNFFDQDQLFDFSKDLFPLMMSNNLPLYGYVAEGYWSDIGNLHQYKQAQFDILDGLVDVQIKGKEIKPGIWIEENVNIHPDARIEAPSFIGEGSSISSQARIAPYTVVGRFTQIEKGASLERTVVWNRNFIDQTATLSGTLLCDEVQVGVGAQLFQGSVVGEKSTVGDLAVVKSKVKIWPEKHIAEKAIQNDSLILEESAEVHLFVEGAVRGIPNVDLTPEKISKLGAAFGSCFKHHSTVTIGSDDHPYSQIFRQMLTSSLMATGIDVRDIGRSLAPVVRYDVRRARGTGAIYIKKSPDPEDKRVFIRFYDGEGLPIDTGLERKIENAFVQEDFARPDLYQVGIYDSIQHAEQLYLEELLTQVSIQTIRERRFQVEVHCDNPHVWSVLKPLLDRLGCDVRFKSRKEQQIDTSHTDVVIRLDGDVESIQLFSQQRWLNQTEMLVIQMILAAKEQKQVAVPVEAPTSVIALIERNGGVAAKTKSTIRSMLSVGAKNPIQVFADGIYQLASLLDLLAIQRWHVSQLVETIPEFHMTTERVDCPIHSKGKVMRRLMEEIKGQTVELIDGIKVLTDDGWALILPDSEKALFKVIAQGNTPDRAGELTTLYKSKIIAYQQI